MPQLTHVRVGAIDIARFDKVLSERDLKSLSGLIEHGASRLRGRAIWNVNSTANGGGVAELLRPLLGYSHGAGVDARWVVISGDADFFVTTKRLHNRLHGVAGDGGALGPAEQASYQRTLTGNARELAELVDPHDVVILHDPQTAGLVGPVKQTGATVIWRCHVGLDLANEYAREAWDFLRPHVIDADAYVFSRRAFVWDGLDPGKISVIQPSIDAFSPKNAGQSREQATAILARAGILRLRSYAHATFTRADGTPGRIDRSAEMLELEPLSMEDHLVLQVSRWDSLKDPLGVLRGFGDGVAPQTDSHLMLAGPATAAVADDPEGATVFAAVREAWHALPAELRRRVHLAALPMEDADENAAIVNALQAHADVVTQKSLAEGFGLTVAEAMWKERAVVASRIGGIQDQIVDGESGVLIDDPHDLAAFASAVVGLLQDPERARSIGAAARRRVREHFLGPHHLERYYDLIQRLLADRAGASAWPAGALPKRSS